MMCKRLLNKLLLGVCAVLLLACAQPVAFKDGQDAREAIASEDMAPAAVSVAARQSAMAAPQQARGHERLGTQWGDEVRSPVTQVDLRRVSATPVDEVALRYADKTYQGRQINHIALVAGKVELAVQSDGRALVMVRDGGQYYVQGRDGQAYQLVYRNRDDKTYEIVASVDGLDVISGQKASRQLGGYVLKPRSTLVIEGFRKSRDAVASFIFSKPADAYAAHTPAGSMANTGIIGSVVYELTDPTNPARPVPMPRLPEDGLQAFPADGDGRGYAPPPQ